MSAPVQKQTRFLETEAPSQVHPSFKDLLCLPGEEESVDVKEITPKPGFVIKCRDDQGKKFFINICSSEEIPLPEKITDEELVALLNSDDTSEFRFPMSIGEGREEVDKSNTMCLVYDVCVHPDVLIRISGSSIYKQVFLSVVVESLSDKYYMKLDPTGVIVLKNRKYMGRIQTMRVRGMTRPLIQEVKSNNQSTSKSVAEPASMRLPKTSPKSSGSQPALNIPQLINIPLIKPNAPQPATSDDKQDLPKQPKDEEPLLTAVQTVHYKKPLIPETELPSKKKCAAPPFQMYKYPNSSEPQYFVILVHLPGVLTSKQFSIQISERFLLKSFDSKYELDINLPDDVGLEKIVAQFNTEKQVLAVRMDY